MIDEGAAFARTPPLSCRWSPRREIEPHDKKEKDAGIELLRQLQVEMDTAVLAAYGWTGDVRLDHDFRVTRRGIRFTLSPETRTEFLDHLLELNRERYLAEQPLPGAPPPRKKSKGRPDTPGQAKML